MSSTPPSAAGEQPTAAPERCLLDTDVVSYVLRGDTRAAAYATYLADKRLTISFMTLAELRRWAVERRWGEPRRQQMERFLRRLDVHYANDALCMAWATIMAERQQLGRPMAPMDAWVAAPAWLLGLPLGTHNRRHFAGVPGLTVVSLAP